VLGKLCVEAGLPPGLVNVIPGTASTSEALVRHPGIGMISFTGGTKAGRAIAVVAADRVIPVLLELGGKSANIVMEDADLPLAAAGVAAGIFGSMGQSCIAGSRLFVHESLREKMVEMLVDTARSLRVGPPGEASTQLGPLASFPHRAYVERMVAGACANGAYFLPTIIDGLPNSSATCQTEIFGPVLCVMPFSDEADLIRQANDTVYGLACGVWSRDFQRAWRVVRRVQAGSVWVNTYRQNSVSTPFGGFKQSGLGRERGVQGLRQYQQTKSVFLGISTAALTFDR
jgi:betaine-aldehyde dehydrogenase